MSEEYENYEAREAEARKAVERWEAEGGVTVGDEPAERAPSGTPQVNDPEASQEKS